MRFACQRAVAALSLALWLAALGGCATSSARPNPRDPWEPVNRELQSFNEGIDNLLLKPVAQVYVKHVPPLVRTGVSNVFNNMSDAWSAVNSLLQGRLQDAEENLARFQINSTFGVLGLFDVASDLNIERHREDFGQTLGRWGVPTGPYLVIPFYGPSTVRDAASLAVDRRYDIVRTFPNPNTSEVFYVSRTIDRRANLLRAVNVLEGAAIDRYAFTRDAYLQVRRAEIFDRGDDEEVPPPLPDESGDMPSQPQAARTPAPAPAPAATPAPAAPAAARPAPPAAPPGPDPDAL
jgi:phospholipid-binding lipoprotein MlaA